MYHRQLYNGAQNYQASETATNKTSKAFANSDRPTNVILIAPIVLSVYQQRIE